MSLDAARIESYTFTELFFLFTTVVICPVANKWLINLKGDEGTMPFLANLRLIKASGLSLRYLNFNRVSNECLKPKLEPAFFNILYFGFNVSI
jgi:hypothetical protein